MDKMSNGTKERVAVQAITNNALTFGSQLIPEIPVGDKAPSFDGHITVYKDSSEKVESFINHVPTQVKGTAVSSFTDGSKKFSLEIKHYQNYYRRGGCLLFVVEIKSNYETKIFYKQLLPLELKYIIETHGSQKKTNVELRPLDETNLYVVCRRFIEQMEKQSKLLIEKNQYKMTDYDKVVLSSLTYNPQVGDITEIFDHDFVEFGVKDKIEYPIGNVKLGEIGILDEDTVIVGSSEHHSLKVETRINKTDKVIIIEDCLEFNLKNEKMNFNFRLDGHRPLSKQIKILKLLIDVLTKGNLKTKSFGANINIAEGVEYKVQLEHTLNSLLKLKEIFSELLVNDDIILDYNNRLYLTIEKLYEVLIKGDFASIETEGLDMDAPGFIKYKIGDVIVVLFLNPKSEKKLINAFSEEMLSLQYHFGIKEDDSIVPISPFFMLEAETIKHAKNINYGTMISSFKQIDYNKVQLVFSQINDFSLKCLNLYDETNNKEYLRTALSLLDDTFSNKEKLDKVSYEIFMVNYLQTKLRFNKELTRYENLELISIRTESRSDNYELMFCISVLLKNKTESEIMFKMLSEERQKLYETMPIFSLYQKLL
ncbi:hypothetical protein LCM23_14720 [Cytobacillus kochii]|uniref:hypothetical protein n=1 Tax=Cytobacillus kochii TaxID=859143 RepID=UPI001CD6BF4A|nr:hypothetical protein [Cytobacillus kochii]MCA1027349.1 hypothetical protein [Cytobacillus kochii]